MWKSRGALLGLEVSAELVGMKRSEQWEQLSAAPFFFQHKCVCATECGPLLDVRLNSTVVRLDICAVWGRRWLGRAGKAPSVRRETWAPCGTVPETGGLMEIQKDLGSAFILNVRHLLGWKENLRSWRKLCQLTDETVSLKVCTCVVCVVCVCTCADSVSVLILKAAPLSERRSVKWGYTLLPTHTKKMILIHRRPYSLKKPSNIGDICSTIICSSTPNHPLLPTQLQSLPPYQRYWSIQFPCVQTTPVWQSPVTTDDHFSPHTSMLCHTLAGEVQTHRPHRQNKPNTCLFRFLTTARKSTCVQSGPSLVDCWPPAGKHIPFNSPWNTPAYDPWLTQDVVNSDAHKNIPVAVMWKLSLTLCPPPP